MGARELRGIQAQSAAGAMGPEPLLHRRIRMQDLAVARHQHQGQRNGIQEALVRLAHGAGRSAGRTSALSSIGRQSAQAMTESAMVMIHTSW